jgi:hypothetical protein
MLRKKFSNMVGAFLGVCCKESDAPGTGADMGGSGKRERL